MRVFVTPTRHEQDVTAEHVEQRLGRGGTTLLPGTRANPTQDEDVHGRVRPTDLEALDGASRRYRDPIRGKTQAIAARARAEQTPADKLEHLKALQTRRAGRVLMVGDGVNDGPVLAAADVSMAMGRGSSLAHATADLLLLRETLSPLPASIQLARCTLRIIRQNLNWAAAYNFTALPIAALGLMPPWVAAIGMSLSSLLVVFNARRLAVDPIKEP